MPKTPKPTQLGVRLEDEIIERIDAIIGHARTMWHEPTRSDIVRAAILAGLPIVEEQARRVSGATGADSGAEPSRTATIKIRQSYEPPDAPGPEPLGPAPKRKPHK